jgi:hypothetical protein
MIKIDWNSAEEIRLFSTEAILLAIDQQGSNQFRKAICHFKALNVL